MIHLKSYRAAPVALIGLAVAAISSPISGAAIYSLGHGDVRFHFSGNALYQRVHIDPESTVDGVDVGNAPDGTEYLSGEVTTLVPQPSFPRPLGAEWDFIGNSPGDTVWYIPDSQEFDRPWLGVSTQALHSTDWADFSLRLKEVNSPVGGHFSLSAYGAFAIDPIFSTLDGIDEADQFQPVLGSHAHYLWFFTKPGTYNVTLEISGLHATAGFLSSTETYQFEVIPEPSSAAMVLVATCMIAFIRPGRRVSQRPRANRGGSNGLLSALPGRPSERDA